MISLRCRRWLRFSLRSLFVLVTVPCLWLGWQARIVHQRKAFLSEVTAVGGKWAPLSKVFYYNGGPKPVVPFWRYWMGDEDIRYILWPKKLEFAKSPAAKRRIERLFSEAWLTWRETELDRPQSQDE